MWLAGCANGPAGPPPASWVGPPPPDLRGTWTGTWGGTPLTLVVTDQIDAAGSSGGVYFGSVQLLGHRTPGIAGVMTSTIAGNPVSTSVEGWLGSTGAAITLRLSAQALHGMQWLTLTRVEPNRLLGRGASDFRWGPQGDVELSRRPAS